MSPTADLDSSLAMAKKAVDIDPESALGYAALSLVHALRGEADLALAGVRRTMTLQPADPRAADNRVRRSDHFRQSRAGHRSAFRSHSSSTRPMRARPT